MNTLATPGLRSAQVRTTAIAMLGVVIVLVSAAFVLVRQFEQEQLRQMDSRLSDAVDFAVRAEANDTLSGSSDPRPDLFVQVTNRAGAVTYATPLLEDLPALVDIDDLDEETVHPETVAADGLGSYRTATGALGESWLTVGEPTEELDDAVGSLIRSLVIGLPFLTLGLGVLVWGAVGRTLRPVDASMRRERQLIDDISHDLRTPLAGARLLVETEPDDLAGRRENRAGVLGALTRLESTVEDVLTLSQLGRINGARPTELVDLDEIVLREVEALAGTAECSIDAQRVSGGQVVGTRSALERLTENLLVNALHHAHRSVSVSLSERDGRVRLQVDDDGPGIPPSDRERIFERFARLDRSRSTSSGGTGLGLAIVLDVALAHDGSVRVDDADLGGASFVVELPASTKPG